jgi:hypothetical protein
LAEQLAHGGELGRYLVKTVVNRGKSSQHVVISTAHRLADRIRAHDVLTRCAVRVGLTWVWRLFGRSVEVVGRTGGSGDTAPPVPPAQGTVLGLRVRRAEAVLSSRADHADKTTADQTATVGAAQSVPRYSGIDYSAGD